jgi:hypothetical protein
VHPDKPGRPRNDRTPRNRGTSQPLTPTLDNSPGSDKQLCETAQLILVVQAAVTRHPVRVLTSREGSTHPRWLDLPRFGARCRVCLIATARMDAVEPVAALSLVVQRATPTARRLRGPPSWSRIP